MNNEYDRGETPPNYDEMVEAGYEMTGDGFWMPKDADGNAEIRDEESGAIVKLLHLRNGQTIISKVSETMTGGEYILEDPSVVTYEIQGDSTNVSFNDWMALSKSRTLHIDKSYVVCSTGPLDSLVETYLMKNDGWTN